AGLLLSGTIWFLLPRQPRPTGTGRPRTTPGARWPVRGAAVASALSSAGRLHGRANRDEPSQGSGSERFGILPGPPADRHRSQRVLSGPPAGIPSHVAGPAHRPRRRLPAHSALPADSGDPGAFRRASNPGAAATPRRLILVIS